jgi:hypothetical protein
MPRNPEPEEPFWVLVGRVAETFLPNWPLTSDDDALDHLTQEPRKRILDL